MIRLNCTACGKEMGLPDGAAGKKVRCPHCQAVLAVPAQVQAAPPPAPPVVMPAEPPTVQPAAAPPAAVVEAESPGVAVTGWTTAKLLAAALGLVASALVFAAVSITFGVFAYQDLTERKKSNEDLATLVGGIAFAVLVVVGGELAGAVVVLLRKGFTFVQLLGGLLLVGDLLVFAAVIGSTRAMLRSQGSIEFGALDYFALIALVVLGGINAVGGLYLLALSRMRDVRAAFGLRA
jgi:LSD1 subclass zinc finger protein